MIFLLLIASLSQAMDKNALCEKGVSNIRHIKIGGNKVGRAFCTQDMIHIEAITNKIEQISYLSTEEKEVIYNDMIDSSLPALCSGKNPFWLYADNIEIALTNGKDKLVAIYRVNKSRCGVNEPQSYSF